MDNSPSSALSPTINDATACSVSSTLGRVVLGTEPSEAFTPDCRLKPVLSSHSKRRPKIGFQD